MKIDDGSEIEVFTDPAFGEKVSLNIQQSVANQMLYQRGFVGLDLSIEQAEALRLRLDVTIKNAQRRPTRSVREKNC